MKRIQVLAFCDSEHETPVRATHERTVAIDGSKPIVLDLCESCDERYVRALLIVMEQGSVAEAPAKKIRASKQHGSPGFIRVCPECLMQSVSRSSLGQHVRHRHGKGLKDYSEEEFREAQRKYDQQG